jgi:ABC-2 type transport system ATP-binding protein
MGRTVAVRSPDATTLADLLILRDATVSRYDGDRLLISGFDIEDVGRLAAAHSLVLYELREEGVSLEETFLALTEQEQQA